MAPNRTGSSSCARLPVSEQLLRSWVAELVATPGLTAIEDPAEAWTRHVEEALVYLVLLGGRRVHGSLLLLQDLLLLTNLLRAVHHHPWARARMLPQCLDRGQLREILQ